MRRISASFRDPSGQVFRDGDSIIRTINEGFKPHWIFGTESGLLQKLVEQGKLLSYSEIEPISDAWKCLRVEKIPFISYPYEWCFSQLKDAALVTIELQNEALNHGMILKDSSAYNVQFSGASPIFIDLLSFEQWREGAPWQAYKQFCTHFLAPLALICKTDVHFSCFSRLWIDGIPLPIASRLLPAKTMISFGLLWHLHLHAKMQIRHGDTSISSNNSKKIRVSHSTLSWMVKSLQKTVKQLKLPQTETEWGKYYEKTNYTDTSTEAKLLYVKAVASKARKNGSSKIAVDLGANTGRYSRCLAMFFDYVIAPDIDPIAVENHYGYLKKNNINNILPLVIDLANLSPGLGWASSERESFISRCQADMVTALALIHHIVITAGIPLYLIAELFYELLNPNGYLLIEFVPKEDSQVKRMLSSRDDIFFDYTLDKFKDVFSNKFEIEDCLLIPESVRTLCIMRKRA